MIFVKASNKSKIELIYLLNSNQLLNGTRMYFYKILRIFKLEFQFESLKDSILFIILFA